MTYVKVMETTREKEGDEIHNPAFIALDCQGSPCSNPSDAKISPVKMPGLLGATCPAAQKGDSEPGQGGPTNMGHAARLRRVACHQGPVPSEAPGPRSAGKVGGARSGVRSVVTSAWAGTPSSHGSLRVGHQRRTAQLVLAHSSPAGPLLLHPVARWMI